MHQRNNFLNQTNNQQRFIQRAFIQYMPMSMFPSSYFTSMYSLPYNQELASFMNFQPNQMQMVQPNQNQINTQVQQPPMISEGNAIKEDDSNKNKKKNSLRYNALTIKYSQKDKQVKDPFHSNFKFSQVIKFYDVNKAPSLTQHQQDKFLNFQGDSKPRQRQISRKDLPKNKLQHQYKLKSKQKDLYSQKNQDQSKKFFILKTKPITKEQIDERKGMYTRSFKRRVAKFDRIQQEQKMPTLLEKDNGQNPEKEYQKTNSSLPKNQVKQQKKDWPQYNFMKLISNENNNHINDQYIHNLGLQYYFPYFNNSYQNFYRPHEEFIPTMSRYQDNEIQVKKQPDD